MQHFWVVGTDTDVGKTLVTACFMRYFQTKGATVTPYKPIQTGMIVEDARHYYGDTQFYQSFSKRALVEEHLNSYSFKEPASPHYAAMLEGEVIEEEVILQHIKQLTSIYDHVICEGAGGLYVPLKEGCTYYLLDLIQQSQLPVVLTAHTKLGTINHTLLSIEALKRRSIPIIGIVFNRFEGTELEVNNMKTIQQHTNLPSISLPKLNNMSDLKDVEIHDTEFMERVLMG